MAHNELVIDASPADVFAVLADGHSYEHWVVGCKKIRAVDASWPNPGASFHHSVGLGPLLIRDKTTVLSREGRTGLELHARAWPAGVAQVAFELKSEGSGTRVLMTENPVEGPAKMLDNPAQQALIRLRNAETLRRLGKLAKARGGVG
ncbi:MAG: SRPBCC family protein [Actinomycetota bacterium]